MTSPLGVNASQSPQIPCTAEHQDPLSSLRVPSQASKHSNAVIVRCSQLARPIRFIDHPEFHLPRAWARFIEAPESQLPSPLHVSQRNSGAFRDLVTYPTPTHEETKRLFLRMNLLKCKAAQLVEGAMEQPLSKEHLLAVHDYLKLAKETKDIIVASNIRVAIKVANRFSRASHVVGDLVSIGCEALMRACESYDCSRPCTFYSYAMRALFSNYSKFMKDNNARTTVHLQDIPFQEPIDQRTHPQRESANNQIISQAIGDMFAQLTERERLAISMRTLNNATFLEIGERLGISKQGAQGVVNRALALLQRQAGVDPRDNLL